MVGRANVGRANGRRRGQPPIPPAVGPPLGPNAGPHRVVLPYWSFFSLEGRETIRPTWTAPGIMKTNHSTIVAARLRFFWSQLHRSNTFGTDPSRFVRDPHPSATLPEHNSPRIQPTQFSGQQWCPGPDDGEGKGASAPGSMTGLGRSLGASNRQRTVPPPHFHTLSDTPIPTYFRAPPTHPLPQAFGLGRDCRQGRSQPWGAKFTYFEFIRAMHNLAQNPKKGGLRPQIKGQKRHLGGEFVCKEEAAQPLEGFCKN